MLKSFIEWENNTTFASNDLLLSSKSGGLAVTLIFHVVDSSPNFQNSIM
jgi:hypothetical protein